MDVYNLAVTSLLVILIFAVYHNNQDIRKLSNSAKSANQVLEKSEVKDKWKSFICNKSLLEQDFASAFNQLELI